MEYEYDTINGQIIAKIVSDIPLKDTKPSWKLSDDRKIYTKVFYTLEEYIQNILTLKICRVRSR